MIYSINIRNNFNEDKQMYLTAENHTKLYRRVLTSYGIPKDRVEILEEFEETPDYGYKLVKSNIAHLTDNDKKVAQKAKELFANNKRRCEPYKTDYMIRHNYIKAINIKDEKDLIPLLNEFKNIKVYWETSKEKRGDRQYYAFVK